MSEQMNTHARQSDLLEQAGGFLEQGDLKGYWDTISEIDPLYGMLAKGVALGGAGPAGVSAIKRLKERTKE
ncbi:MAG: hypothetical protein ACPGNT_05395 [Rhodospirillales bacterium]